jgi:hypothetical protein
VKITFLCYACDTSISVWNEEILSEKMLKNDVMLREDCRLLIRNFSSKKCLEVTEKEVGAYSIIVSVLHLKLSMPHDKRWQFNPTPSNIRAISLSFFCNEYCQELCKKFYLKFLRNLISRVDNLTHNWTININFPVKSHSCLNFNFECCFLNWFF